MSDTEERVRAIVAEHLGLDQTKIELNSEIADDLGADSLEVVELVMRFEEEFGIEIPDGEAEKIVTVEHAVKFLDSRRS
ncbi:acyl carrier protein [Aurantimonas endophytica]|jgi:acyl carrier protein|uniref:Acyl carrier protein n=1 Tax=Aurantimonas endophytica TaxID=1522175 RepID=A0A7W6HGD6_9HYPH|nr:acyl carrier protein [Aurantimonas endophytica]MBB4004673.1 acyl carrier protein [Aurantimonas endophytica]MCO6405498.1 acyl carrier protein [Aurantimonas endophytica]